MMPIAPLPLTKQKNLTEVGHLGDHSHNQRRFALMLPHFIGIGAPLHRNTHLGQAYGGGPIVGRAPAPRANPRRPTKP